MTSMNGVTLISGRTDAMATAPPPAPQRGDDIERVVVRRAADHCTEIIWKAGWLPLRRRRRSVI
jgi:hypothetical protein